MGVAAEIATSQAVWAILCIGLAGIVLRELRKENVKRETDLLNQYTLYREESRERESKLMDHLERSNESQEKTAKALQSINSTLSALEGRVDRIEKYSFKKEGSDK